MRKLLNTLFVLSEDSYLALEGETVIILAEEQKRGQFPLHTLEGILSFSYKGASPALMGACAARGVDPVSYTHLDVYKRQGICRSSSPPPFNFLNLFLQIKLPAAASCTISPAA